jgi:DNA invertase Pin-like site-specific DNA recombinase
MVKNYKVAYPLRILDSKFENNKVFYLVQWRNFRLPTWEPKNNIVNRQDLIDEYRDLSILENLELDDCAYIYCRVSSKRQSDVGHTSLEVQENLCKQYCLDNDIKVIKVVKEAYSARNMDRLDGLKYLCDIVTSGQKIVVYDVSRFSRNTRQALNIIENLKQNKVSVYAVVEKLSYDTPAEQHQFRMQLSCAQQYSDMLSLKVSNSVSYRKCNGHSLGTAAFGFKHIRDDNNIRKKVVNVDEMKIVERIRQLKTETPRTIVNILIEENIKFRGRNPTLLNVRKITKRFNDDLSEVNRNSGKVRKLRTRRNTSPY